MKESLPAATLAHRHRVGGLWDELGRLQVEFLRRQGLRQDTKLLDVGCGCLRGGIHFVRFLDPGCYFGIDVDPELLRAGFEIELPQAGLATRLPRDHLLLNGAFEAWRFGVVFDWAWAQSVFTHLPPDEIARCLREVARCVRPGGRLYATFFENAGDASSTPLTHQPGGITTYADRDPFHYRFEDLRALCAGSSWDARYVGEWNHPRAQRMARFDRRP